MPPLAMPASLKKALAYQHADVQKVVIELWNALGPSEGDVVGPSVAVNNNIAVFDSTTGKLIKDGGQTIAQLLAAAAAAAVTAGYVVGPASAVDSNLAVFDGTTGKLIKDGGAP